ncbi:MAG TPA: hypothetical protein VF297_32165 [Pyrinomonadaceae bacterium]
MQRKPAVFNLIFLFTIWLGLILGCANTGNQSDSQRSVNSNSGKPSQPAIKSVVDIPQLVGRAPAELDKVLGKPVAVTKITNDPEMMPGEYRDYKIENTTGNVTQEGLMVRFYQGQAIHFTFDLPSPADTPEEALLMAGIDVKGAAAKIKAPLADRWAGNFNGVEFKDVAALKMDSGGKKYSTVQAERAR